MRLFDLHSKEVINVADGARLGYVGDLDIRLPDGQVLALFVFAAPRVFGLFGRGEEYYVPWECVRRMGDDVILVDQPFQRREALPARPRRRRR